MEWKADRNDCVTGMHCVCANGSHVLEASCRLEQCKIICRISGNNAQFTRTLPRQVTVNVSYAFADDVVVGDDVSITANEKSAAAISVSFCEPAGASTSVLAAALAIGGFGAT